VLFLQIDDILLVLRETVPQLLPAVDQPVAQDAVLLALTYGAGPYRASFLEQVNGLAFGQSASPAEYDIGIGFHIQSLFPFPAIVDILL